MLLVAGVVSALSAVAPSRRRLAVLAGVAGGWGWPAGAGRGRSGGKQHRSGSVLAVGPLSRLRADRLGALWQWICPHRVSAGRPRRAPRLGHRAAAAGRRSGRTSDAGPAVHDGDVCRVSPRRRGRRRSRHGGHLPSGVRVRSAERTAGAAPEAFEGGGGSARWRECRVAGDDGGGHAAAWRCDAASATACRVGGSQSGAAGCATRSIRPGSLRWEQRSGGSSNVRRSRSGAGPCAGAAAAPRSPEDRLAMASEGRLRFSSAGGRCPAGRSRCRGARGSRLVGGPCRPDRQTRRSGSRPTGRRGACRPGRERRRYARCLDVFGCEMRKLSWMWQTQTSPVRRRPQGSEAASDLRAPGTAPPSRREASSYICVDKYITRGLESSYA